VGSGLSNKILPFFPVCHQLSPSSLNPSSFYLFSTFVTISFLLCGVVSPTQNPQPGGPGYPFLSGSSPWTYIPCYKKSVNCANKILKDNADWTGQTYVTVQSLVPRCQDHCHWSHKSGL
jgi:hypothetical protein